MAVFTIICPDCGRAIETETYVDFVYCDYCEKRIDVQKYIKDQKLQFEEDTKSFNTLKQEHLDKGDEFLDDKNYMDALKEYAQAVSMDEGDRFPAQRLIKCANIAIEDHYTKWKDFYLGDSHSVIKSSINEDIDIYKEARDYAYQILSSLGYKNEIMVTPTEREVEEKLRKKHLLMKIGGIAVFIVSVAVVVGLVVGLGLIK
ncbi:MAG: hypothetical protein MJ133_11895 [Lachnospiraceae bacterium]|nr:hypothetical protein [Lachnospiraceae bacterium]